MTKGEKLADKVAETLGSWRFIGFQLTVIGLWAILNSVPNKKMDPYPYSFLNLVLGVQSALTGPILLIAGNRQEKLDRKRAIENLELDRISHEDLKKIAKRIEESFAHIDKDIEEVARSIDGE